MDIVSNSTSVAPSIDRLLTVSLIRELSAIYDTLDAYSGGNGYEGAAYPDSSNNSMSATSTLLASQNPSRSSFADAQSY